LQIFSLRRSEVEIALPMMFKFLALGLIALAQVLVAQALASPNYFCTWAASSSLAGAWSAAAINAAGDGGRRNLLDHRRKHLQLTVVDYACCPGMDSSGDQR
jgi:hypothetical protein